MVTDYKQSTIGEMVESERLLVLEAHERYPAFYPHAEEAVHFLSTFVRSIKADRHIFGSFLSHLKKHAMLALFSTVRLHRVQAMMDLRQVLEAGTAAAFAMVHPEHEHFVTIDEKGLIDPSPQLVKRRYAWLAKTHPRTSASIKGQKDLINEHMSHANLLSADGTFRVSDSENSFDAPFFDFEDEHFVKIDLWMIGDVAIGLMELFYLVDDERGFITFVDDFLVRLNRLQDATRKLRAEMIATERYKAVQHLTPPVAPEPGG
jgi:hypothetical protein